MIKDGFLFCPCGKKIMPLTGGDVVFATVYCIVCKSHYKVVAVDGKLYKMERVAK